MLNNYSLFVEESPCMLPRPLYEALPYCYFIVGSILWLSSSSGIEILAGALLYFAGAQQWVLRSNYRRSDRIKANLLNSHPQPSDQGRPQEWYPRWLYEMLPFLYIALGYQLANLLHNPTLANTLILETSFAAAASLCLIIAGFLALALRGQHRFQHAASSK